MNLPGFYALHWAWLFLLLVPLIVLYFLKLKRPRFEIPSLALWRSVLNDQRVNSPFQKFKRNLLLLLQVLLLILLVLAAMQPFAHSGAERAEYLPILIDNSASMAALDQPGGRTRLDLAKERVGQIIDDLLPDQRVSLIAVHSTARRLTDFTNNKRVLRDALDKITVAQVPSRIEDGLRMAQALARTVPIETVLMFTDGNVPEQVNFELPFDLNYQRIAAGGKNIGITAFNARRSGTDAWDVFARIEGSRAGQTAADLQLLQDGQPAGEDNVLLEPSGSQRLVFRIRADKASHLELRLKPDGFDALDADNVAYLDLPAPRPLLAYCPPELEAYRHALSGLDGVLVYPDAAGDTASSYDLLITDRSTGNPEAPFAVYVGVIPDDLTRLLSVRTGLAEIVDWKRSEPILQHVNLAGVQIADEPVSAEGAREQDYEEAGYSILAHGRNGPLVLEKRDGRKLSYYLLFHSDRSTLPYRVGFPILVANAVQLATAHADLSEVRAQPTGVLPSLNLQPDREYRIAGPDGSRHQARSDADGVLFGVPAPRVGRYEVTDGGRTAAAAGVSLVASQETSLATVEELQFREISVKAAEATVRTDQPLWRYFALAGFGLLLVEWWYFQKRPGGVPV